MNPRLEVSPGLESGRYWVQLTLKYHRCGSVRDDGTRCVSGGVLPPSTAARERGIGSSDKGLKDWPTLWTLKLADRREFIRVSREIRAAP